MENENMEIVFVCNSTNNKNVRAGELKILEKHPDELYFVFGENSENSKKRYYNDLKTLEKDFEKLEQIKKDLETPKKPKTDPEFSVFEKEPIEEKKEKKPRKRGFLD